MRPLGDDLDMNPDRRAGVHAHDIVRHEEIITHGDVHNDRIRGLDLEAIISVLGRPPGPDRMHIKEENLKTPLDVLSSNDGDEIVVVTVEDQDGEGTKITLRSEENPIEDIIDGVPRHLIDVER